MPQVDQVLKERYQLKQQLGNNPGRQTWLAQDLQTDKAVVVKLLIFHDQVQWDDVRLSEREAQILRQLDHPQIPCYYDHFSLDDRNLWFGLVQEYIPGHSLKQLLAYGKHFTEPQLRQLATEVLKILVYLHELSPPVLHRDIKPSNLMLDEHGQLHLIDFGAVQDKAAREGATFTVVGTYGYAPMEQFGGRAVAASDLYSLGATLIHLATGVAPADLPQKDLRIQFADRVSLSPALIQWIQTLVEPDVDDRFPTARQALAALKRPPTPVISRPVTSRCQLKKSDRELIITVPPRGIQPSDTPYLVFLVFWVLCTGLPSLIISPIFILASMASGSAGLMAWPLLLVGCLFSLFFALLPFWFLVLPAYSQLQLRLNRQQFVLEWKLFGLCYRRHEGPTMNVESVHVQVEPSSNQLVTSANSRNKQYAVPAHAIVLRAGLAYKFGVFAPLLTPEEQHWVVQEIKSWLKLH